MILYTSTPDFYGDYISHHGIKGQKWGVRNGPPYPLTSNGGGKTEIKKITNADLLTEKKIRIDDKRSIEAAKLGIKAINEMTKSKDLDSNNKSDQFWFLFEDQTIGFPLIADLVNQGKSKRDIMDMYEIANKPEVFKDHAYEPGFFEFNEIDKDIMSRFVDHCIDIKKKKINNKNTKG